MALPNRCIVLSALLGLVSAGCAQVKSAPDELGTEPDPVEGDGDASVEDTPEGEDGEEPADDAEEPDAAPQPGDGEGDPPPLPVDGVDLPLAVDDYFTASGFMGDAVSDALAVTMTPSSTDADVTCGGDRSSAGARGACHRVKYTPSTTTGAPGWAGVYWQAHVNDWGDQPGLLVDSGAVAVSFWARGKLGGEIVTFGVGGIAAAGKPYRDDWAVERTITLTTTWTEYILDLGTTTYDDVLGGFRWSAGKPQNPSGLEFVLDDIQWR
jgi:hypothetical protein